MTAKTFTSAGVDNLWSNAANWNGGTLPVDNDSITIPLNETVVFDVDTSSAVTWPNGIAGITVTGTLKVSTVTSSYLKLKAATTISGAGTFNIGTQAAPIPFAVKHTLTGGTGWYVQGSGGLTMTVYGAEPTYTTVKTTGAEAIGSTRLEIDTDLTGDIWAATDAIRIDNVASAQNSEARIIGAITSTYIDITAGLTAAKIAGTVITLITRNVTIAGLGANVLQNFASGKLTLAGGSLTSDNLYGLYICTGASISGGTISGCVSGLYACIGVSISGGTISGCYYGVGSCTGVSISGGTISGCYNGLYICTGASISGGTISGCGQGLYSCTGASISGGTISGCGQGLYYCSARMSRNSLTTNTYDLQLTVATAYNTLFGSSTEYYQYTTLPRIFYSESIDHDQQAGAFKSWTKGGIGTSVATPVPAGLTRAYQLALENATVEGFFNRRVNVPAGKTIMLTLYLRKSASMTYLPRVWVHIYGTEPFTTAGDILHTFTMTNSVDTWETDTYSWTNTADYDVELNCRFVGMNATGYVYGQVTDAFAGGTGGISRARVLGGV